VSTNHQKIRKKSPQKPLNIQHLSKLIKKHEIKDKIQEQKKKRVAEEK